MIVFHNKTTTRMDEVRSVDIVYLDFSRTSGMVSQSILAGKLRKYGLNERSGRCIEKWLNDLRGCNQ